ncbi:unnamed protein product [Adineta steineri]|uniref:Hint domain-containing protein n=1 Tax=Adineta steineri TaxID=433720 RepID=A0A819RP28_9BILA|nr:unnamed protein product [Adineta steineri]CAF4048095.1 unnamed protein product [Adineta steineri]
MYGVLLVFVVVINVLLNPKTITALPGSCLCTCCSGSQCIPTLQPAFRVDACLSCTNARCTAEYPSVCPSELELGSTSKNCLEDTTTTTTTTRTTATTTRFIPTTTTPRATTTTTPPPCFASTTTVRLANGHIKKISDLVVGDLVFVESNEKVISSPILATFRYYRSSIRFVDIYAMGYSIPLRLTPQHSLLVLSNYGKNKRYSFAQNVSVGDLIFSSDLSPLKVVDVKEIIIYDDSVYALLTFEGTIIANDIVASCYGTFDHSTMHMITTPIRWWFLVLFEFRQLIGFDYLQELTSNIIISFVDFYLQFTHQIGSYIQ